MSSSTSSSSQVIQLLLNGEMDEPKMVIAKFFQSFEMEDAMFQLREAMQIVVEKKFANCEYSIEEDNARFFFEKLEKLLAAAYLLQ